MRLALVAMPWSRRDRPSAAVGALAAYVRRERPDIEVASRSEFVELAYRIGIELYDQIADTAYTIGEPLYAPLLYPERREHVRQAFVDWAAKTMPATGDAEAAFDRTFAALGAHLDALADELAASADVIGLTTCFGQLFANLALARAIKERKPSAIVILGGSTVSARIGPSVLSEYPFIDFILQGEGELPLIAVLDALVAGDRAGAAARKGVLSQATAAEHPNGAAVWEVPNMDALPFPDYDEYAALADEHGIDWRLPIEGSRGCWWDRTKRKGNPKDTCYFCNLNLQWSGYREKSVARVVEELAAHSDKHQNLKIYFLDNIIRNRGVLDLADGIVALGKDFEIFYEMRASIRPHELAAMWEAGLRDVQFGIEGLSTSLLKRIGKGTTLLQNLQAMRLCKELGIANFANLIIDFPGSTPEEVAATTEAIGSLALSFEPLRVCPFLLGVDSTVERLREEFGVIEVRNRDSYRAALPDKVQNRLRVLDLSFDLVTPVADWTPVVEACARWEALHRRKGSKPLLHYRDGGTFLVIEDDRFDDFRSGTFDGVAREVYLYCTEIRSREEIARQFEARASPASLDEILTTYIDFKIMAHEKEQFLALAIATSPHLAVRRIRAGFREPTSPLPRLAIGQSITRPERSTT